MPPILPHAMLRILAPPTGAATNATPTAVTPTATYIARRTRQFDHSHSEPSSSLVMLLNIANSLGERNVTTTEAALGLSALLHLHLLHSRSATASR
jgi:hypothetical protein